MALTSTELLDLLSLDPTDPANTGRMRATKKEGTIPGYTGTSRLSLDEVTLIDELMAAPTRPTVVVERAPWSAVRARHQSQRRPLNAFDLAWMEGLPKDPAEVAEFDALELHRLLLEAEPGSSEARLIAQRFAPVEALHERRAEERNRAALAKVERFPVPPIPARAKAMLAAAIEAEHPDLHPNEAAQRARDALAAAEGRRRPTWMPRRRPQGSEWLLAASTGPARPVGGADPLVRAR